MPSSPGAPRRSRARPLPPLTARTDPGAGVPLACAAALVLAVAWLGYRGSLGAPFTFDDLLRIPENPYLRQLWPPWQAMAHTSRPLVQLTLAANYAAGGLDVGSYHATNVAIHALAGLALLALAYRTLRRASASAFDPRRAAVLAGAIALLWTAHPLQTQAVTYVIQRSESMMALGCLLALLGLERAAAGRHAAAWGAAVIACGLLAAASKTIAVALPPLALLYDRAFLSGSFRRAWRERWGLHLGMLAVWILAVALLAAAPEEWARTAGFGTRGVTPLAYAATQPGVILHYLRLALWPAPLVIDYGWPLARDTGAVVLPALAIALLLAATAWATVRRPRVGFLGAAFFLVLAPTSSVIPVADAAFEHRMYLPLAAVVALAVLGADALLRRLEARAAWSATVRRGVAMVLLAAALIALVAATARRNQDYASEKALWADTVAKRPLNARARNNLGNALEREGDLEGAIAEYREALRLTPAFADAHNNLGKALDARGETAAAVTEYREALRLDPDHAWAHCNLGVALAKLGNLDQGIGEIEAALRLDPRFPDAHFNLGLALARRGELDRAIPEYRTALALRPGFAAARTNLGVALARQGRLDDAILEFNQVVRATPTDVEAITDLGLALGMLGRRDQATRELERALAIAPDYLPAQQALARMRSTP